MSIRNNHWYNLNEQRSYPLDDSASALSNAGDRLPAALISDLRLRWPVTYGKYAFVSAASVTSSIITVMIEATDDLDNSPSSSTLIAGVSVPLSSFVEGRTYALTAFQDGVGGFITFGSGTDKPYRGLFSSPRQGLLTPRAARFARLPPVPTLGIAQVATALKGVVNLTAVEPLRLTKETRVIGGVEYDNVIVFRLIETTTDIATGTSTESVFRKFSGPCGNRTGSKSCSDPQPVQTINSITPDCDGVITLEFQGCATIGRNTVDCGVVIDCDLGLSASCNPLYLPDLTTGKLPSEVTSVIIPPPIPPEPPTGDEVSISETVLTVLALPYCDMFDDEEAFNFSPTGNSLFGVIGDDSPNEMTCCDGPDPAIGGYGCYVSESASVDDGPTIANIVTGGFGGTSFSTTVGRSVLFGFLVNPPYRAPMLRTDVVASYGAVAAAAQARTNISLFTADVQTLFRKYTTDIKIVPGQTGSLLNGGILANFKTTVSGLNTYYLAKLDIDNSLFGVYYFNGIQMVALLEVTVADVRSSDWYTITFQLLPNTITQTSVQLVATLTGVDDPSIVATLNTTTSSTLWSSDSGLAGLYAKRSFSYFSYWRIDEAS